MQHRGRLSESSGSPWWYRYLKDHPKSGGKEESDNGPVLSNSSASEILSLGRRGRGCVTQEEEPILTPESNPEDQKLGETEEVRSHPGASQGGKKTVGDVESESENLITEELTFV